jgi:regulator of replication initiation timing
MDGLQKTVYDKEAEIDKLKAELDEVKRQRNAFVPAVEQNLELRNEREALHKLVDFMSAGNRERCIEMQALKGSLASAQRELTDMKSTESSAPEVVSLQRELAEMTRDRDKMKRKVEYTLEERDRASAANSHCRRQLEEAHNKTKREFFTKHQMNPLGGEKLPKDFYKEKK